MRGKLFFIGYLIFNLHSFNYAQVPEFAQPVKLNDSINSKAEEINPLISHDGLQLYFSRALYDQNKGGKYAGMDIWHAVRSSKYTWSNASNVLGKLNNRKNNAVLGIKQDGEIIYLLNSYDNKEGIAFSKTGASGWTNPESIKIDGLTSEGFIGYYVHPSYEVLLVSMRSEGSSNEDLYVCLKDSTKKWGKPINLGPTINTDGFEISPFLSSDMRVLFFASNGHGGYGDSDIYMSERLYNNWTNWSKPQNLGSTINSEMFDAYLSIAHDSTVIFSSNRGGGFSDLYQTSIIGVQKNQQVILKEKLISDARNIISELRNQSTEEFFIEFELLEDDLGESQKLSMKKLINNLAYTRYSKINLLSFAGDNEDEDIHDRRISKIVNYLKLSGINEEKIDVMIKGNFLGDQIGTQQNGKQGILIIVSDLP